jgi:uncharacterized protein YecE (DUF72 family)
MAKKWAKVTPEHFRFTAKVPRSITHEKRLNGVESEKDLAYFFQMMQPLKSKLLALLIQLPPSLTAKEGLKKIEALIQLFDTGFRYAIEVRNKSWFVPEVYKLLSDNNICLTWSQLDTIQTPPELTTDFVYLRLIGDRSIDEKDFGTIQKDRVAEMKKWANIMQEKKKKKTKNLKIGIVAANNHYAGFGPATANNFRRMIGMEEAAWDEMKQQRL